MMILKMRETCVFFFKQKTAYEMLRSLVGSEMCIRDSMRGVPKEIYLLKRKIALLGRFAHCRFCANLLHVKFVYLHGGAPYSALCLPLPLNEN